MVLFFLRCAQERRADPGIDKIGDQRAEAHVGEEMIGHMNAVVAIEQNENTGNDKRSHVFPRAALFPEVREHRQGEHHGSNGHIAAGPALKVIVTAREVRYHLPPLAELAFRVIQRDQIFIAGAGANLLEPKIHVVRYDACNEDRRAHGDQLLGVCPVHELHGYEGDPGVEHRPKQPT